MLWKPIKYGVIVAVAAVALGGLVFGTDVFSYVSSGAKSLRTSVKSAIPVEVELQRARDLLEEIVPEIQSNVRVIATEEVEVENLKQDITHSQANLVEAKARIQKLSGMLAQPADYFTISDRQYSRQAVKTDLARRFEQYKEAEAVLAGKHRLLTAREKSLDAAMQMLEKARSRKVILADRIEGLVAQHRLVQAAAVGSKVQLDSSKLAQTEKLIGQIKKRLDVAERVLAHEGQFVEPIEVDVVNEKDLLAQVAKHFDGHAADGKAIASAQPAQTATETPASGE